VSIPQIDESDPSYYKVATPKEFMDAINAENSASKGTVAAKIIEITADLDMGYLEVTNQYGTLRNFESHNNASLHPRLIQTGIGKIVIQDRDGDHSKYNEGLMIYSKTGHTIRHATFMIKYSHNIIIRNLRFAELWEWDEKTKGNYDSNDWDYFTLRDVDGIWFDHIEMEKAYDGLIDFKGEDDPEDTVVNATFSFLDLDFQPNEFILEQFEYLEANQASNPYYKGMRDAGMSMEEILELNSFQKKGFLLGGSELRAGNRFTLTIYNSRLCNLQDRFPRLRGGDVHIFNCVYDASDVYRTRQEVLTNYPVLFGKTEYQRQLTNQAIVTTENGAVLVENSVFIGVSQPIKSNQVSADHPTMTGKYQVLNSIYRLDDTEFLGSSEDSSTPFVRSNSEPILPFSWTTIEALPYEEIALIDPTLLEALLDSAILGCTALTFPWMS
jgi:pectate lyase